MPARKNAFSLSGVLKTCVVGSFARFGVEVQHVAERLRAAPVAEPLGEQRADRVRDRSRRSTTISACEAPKKPAWKLAQIGDRGAPLMNASSSSIVDDVAHVVGRIVARPVPRVRARRRSPAARCARLDARERSAPSASSSSASGNAGSRSTSIASSSVAARFSRVLWMFAVARPAPPPTLSWLCSRASSSWISCRDLLARAAHQHLRREPARAGRRPSSCSRRRSSGGSAALTASPRVSFGSMTSLMPPGSSTREVRDVDVRRRRVERLAFGARLVALVALQHRGDVGPRRNLGAVGLAGHEQADGAVRGLEVLERRALRVGRRVAVRTRSRSRNIKRQSPIDAQLLSWIAMACELFIACSKPDIAWLRMRSTSSAVIGFALEVVDRRDHRGARRVERRVLGHHREEDHHAGVAQLQRLHADLRREPRLDERLVEPARRLVGRAPRPRSAAARSPRARRPARDSRPSGSARRRRGGR